MSYDIDITKTPPGHEPERQYYYMAKAKDFVEKKSKEIGRPMTYFVKTFGCQMNARDSEKLVGILEKVGYEIIEDENADFVKALEQCVYTQKVYDLIVERGFVPSFQVPAAE